MSTFRERIREELAKPPREDAGEKVPAQFEDVLFDFAEGLEEARPSLSPVFEEDRVHRLLVFPKHRRDLEYTAFRYRWTGSALRIAFGEEGDFDEVRSPKELREHLLRLLRDAEFRETIDEYEEICKEDVPAALYEDPEQLLAGFVVPVAVKAEDQAKIAMAKPGERLTIRAKPRLEAGEVPRTYDPSDWYLWFESGGYQLRVLEHRRKNKEIVVVVEKGEDDEELRVRAPSA